MHQKSTEKAEKRAKKRQKPFKNAPFLPYPFHDERSEARRGAFF